MKSALIFVLACLFLIPAPGAQAAPAQADIVSVAASNNAFALKLYRQLSPGGDNMFFSPYSIESALAMTYQGAKGNTAKQMAEVLGFTLDQAKLHPAMAKLSQTLSLAAEAKDQKLTVANALWVGTGMRLLSDFTATLKANYGAAPRSVDFNAPKQAAAAINQWVDRHTQSMIKKLVTPNDVSGAALVLTNAIYFQGKWVKAFKKNATKPALFFTAPDKTVQAQMMHQTSKFAYAEDDDSQVLTMPYRGDGLELVVLLPKAKNGLAALEASLNSRTLAAKLGGLKVQKVSVYLPRLKMDTKYMLKEALLKLGMVDAFSGRADFSGITGRRGLLIDKVIHKARLELDEEGTKAAAATAVIIAKSAGVRPKVFKADHPFIFMIRHRPTGAIVFMGRVTDPNG